MEANPIPSLLGAFIRLAAQHAECDFATCNMQACPEQHARSATYTVERLAVGQLRPVLIYVLDPLTIHCCLVMSYRPLSLTLASILVPLKRAYALPKSQLLGREIPGSALRTQA
jgi:hypothetical protein